MKYSTAFLSFSALLVITFSASLRAHPDNNQLLDRDYLYLGARASYTYYEKACEDIAIDCEQEGAAYGFFAGYQFGRNLGLELSYNDLPDVTAVYPAVELKGKSRVTDLSLKLSHYLKDSTQLYAKMGAAYWEGEVKGREPVLEEKSVKLLLGTGLEFILSTHWSARLEYRYIHQIGNDEMGHSNPHFAGAALLWKIPAKRKVVTSPVLPPVILEPEPEPVPIPKQESAPERRIVVSEEFGGPLFGYDKSEIRHTAAIDQVVDILLNDLDLKVTVIGHTDSRGSHEYNKKLSERRAQAVATYLNYKGVNQDRIKIFGMGEDQPVAENETDLGRSKNRRVEFVISTIKTLP